MAYGWSGQILTPDGTEVKENYDDIVDFIKRQWSDHHSALGWNVYTDDPIAEASEVKEFPVAFGPKKTPGLIENTRRGFDPRTTERYHLDPQLEGLNLRGGLFHLWGTGSRQRDCPQARQVKGRGRWEWRSYDQSR